MLSEFKGPAAIARPQNYLLVGKSQEKASKETSVIWIGDKTAKKVDAIIDRLTNPYVLVYAKYSIPFKVHINASTNGLGAVLYQNQDGAG